MTENNWEGPLVILGSPRSGTSLFRLILASHSQINVPPECGFLIWLQPKYQDWECIDNDNSEKVDTFLDDLLACKKIETWSLDRDILKNQIELLKPATYSELAAVVYKTFGLRAGKGDAIWGDKNNYYIKHLAEINALYPNAKYLHIVRDGRDVACSYREVMDGKSNSPYAPKLPTNIQGIATEWSSNVETVESFFSELGSKNGKVIRYEDLVRKPDEAIQLVCDWLGVDFEPQMLDFYSKNRESKLEPESLLDWKKRTLEPISDDTVGRYKINLTLVEQKEFIAVAGDVLSRHDYRLE